MAQNRAGLELTVRVRQLVQMLDQPSGWVIYSRAILPKGDALNGSPFSLCSDQVHQLQESVLAFEPNDTVDFRNEFERFLITQAGKVPTHRKVASYSVFAEVIDKGVESLDVELKN